jgi:hypothetical protein
LENVHIIQGATFYREVGENFPRCAFKRKKYLEAAFGPIRVSWPWHYLLRTDGPFQACQGAHAGEGEKHQVRSSCIAFCVLDNGMCPTTKLINMQVLEICLADGIISRVTLLSCGLDNGGLIV